MSDILIKPLVTEKLTRIQTETGKVSFEVLRSSTKPEIKKAVEKAYPGDKVGKVNTMIMPSKPKGRHTRSGFQSGRSRTWKKAIVTIQEGEIDFFEEI